MELGIEEKDAMDYTIVGRELTTRETISVGYSAMFNLDAGNDWKPV